MPGPSPRGALPARAPGRAVVIGGDAAGMSAASQLARAATGATITVLERGEVVSYAACGLPYLVAGAIRDPASLLVRSPAAFARAGIGVRLGHEAVAIDPGRGLVRVVDHRSGTECDVAFDRLLVATGARAVVPPVPGADAPNVFVMRHYDDALALGRYLDVHRPAHATVIGAGYIGLEMAEALAARCDAVTVLEAATQVMPGLDGAVAALIAAELERHGVEVRLGHAAEALEADATGHVVGVRTEGGAWPTGVVVVGVGVRPNVELATAAGLAADETGALGTDKAMRTAVEGVWAAGDCTSTVHLVTGQRVWVPLGPTANKQGRTAGASMAGEEATFRGVVGTSLVKVFDLHVGRTGLTSHQADAAGLDAATVAITAHDHAGYYPGAEDTTVLLLAERSTGRLLGAQIVGRSGVAGRTNVVAAALHASMGVDDLAALDLGYAPPFAPVWDPLLVAANRLRHEVAAG